MIRRHALAYGILVGLIVAGVLWIGSPQRIESAQPLYEPVAYTGAPSHLLFVPLTLSQSLTANCSNTSVGLMPLTDLGTGTYLGYEGGLYPGGSNQVPAAYLQTGLNYAAEIQPLDSKGNPSPKGQIVLLSIGMSNAFDEYGGFVTSANSDPLKSSYVQVVNGAEKGQTADIIINPSAAYWTYVDTQVAQAGATDSQVQAIWLKEGINYNTNPPALWPTDAQNLQSDLAQIITILEGKFPNLRIIYMASRTYGGYASIPLNPDGPPQGPSYYAYDSGFAVKWLIQDRINGVTSGAEWLTWGPYLWADGTILRSDGLQWLCSDFMPDDGTHPSDSGIAKVAGMLLSFFHTDPTAQSWYLFTAATATPGSRITPKATARPIPKR